MGHDSDAEIAHGEVGKVGVAIDSIDDMKVLFDGIPLDEVSTSMTINAPAALLLLMYQIVAEDAGIPAEKLTGTIQNDVLKEYIARGTYIFPPQESLRLITDIFSYCRTEIPRWNTISISGYHMAEAGATPAQEFAFSWPTPRQRARGAGAGLAVDYLPPAVSSSWPHHTCSRRWRSFARPPDLAQLMRDEFGATNPMSLMLRFHTQTAACSLPPSSPSQPGPGGGAGPGRVLGGTQSLHTNSYDEAIARHREFRQAGVAVTQSPRYNRRDRDRRPVRRLLLRRSLTDELEAAARELMARWRTWAGRSPRSSAGSEGLIEASAYLI